MEVHGTGIAQLDIAIGWWLDSQGVGVWVLVGARFISSPRRPHRFSAFSPGVKRPEREANHSLCTSCRGQEYVDLYIHSNTCFHGLPFTGIGRENHMIQYFLCSGLWGDHMRMTLNSHCTIRFYWKKCDYLRHFRSLSNILWDIYPVNYECLDLLQTEYWNVYNLLITIIVLSEL
jgi:hypothetical protein